MAKGDLQNLLNELKGLDPSTPITAEERINFPLKEDEMTAAPRATGLGTYLANRAGRALTGENTASLLSMILPKDIGESLTSSVRRQQGKLLGLEQLGAPEGYSSRVVQGAGNVVSAISDPLSYIGPGSLARKAVEAGAGAITGDVGGEIGKGVGETGQLVGGLVGGAIGANTAGTAVSLGKAGIRGAKQLKEGKLNEEALNHLSDTYVSNIFKHATVIDKTFPQKLNQAILESGNVGVDLPIMSLVDNPVITKAIDNLMATNTDFRGAYKAQWDKAKAIVEKRNQDFFGSPFEAAKTKVTSTIPSAEKAIKKKVESLDSKIREISQSYDINPDKRGLGEQLSTLIDRKHEEAIKEAAPSYQKAFDYAKQNNVELTSEDTKALYDFVSDEKNKDIFAKFPRLYSEVKQVFSPKEAEGLVFNPLTKTLTPTTKRVFSGQDIEVLDSLKRRVNKDLRKSYGKDGEEFLDIFKEKLQNAINNSSPEFSTLYKAADENYYKTVGIPYNSETAKAISRAKYDEQIVPMITRNTSMLSDMLKATGEEGVAIAEAAFIDRFSKVVDPQNKGIIDPIKAQKWIKENKNSLNLLPELKAKLEGDTLSILDLQNSKNTLNLNFARAKAQDILGGEGLTPSQIISRSMSDPTYLTKVLTKYKGTDTMEAIRAVALDDLMSYKSPIEAFNDKTKAAFYNRVFEGRVDKIKELANISSRLSQFTPEDIALRFKTAIPKDKFEEATGIASASAFSTMRSKVMSTVQKAFYLGSQIFNAKGAESQDKKLAEILLNPKALDKELPVLLKFNEGKALSTEEVKTFLKVVQKFAIGKGSSIGRGAYVGASTQSVEQLEDKKGTPKETLKDYLEELKK